MKNSSVKIFFSEVNTPFVEKYYEGKSYVGMKTWTVMWFQVWVSEFREGSNLMLICEISNIKIKLTRASDLSWSSSSLKYSDGTIRYWSQQTIIIMQCKTRH